MKILLTCGAGLSCWKFTESLEASLGKCYSCCRQLEVYDFEEVNFVFEDARIVMSWTMQDSFFFDADLYVANATFVLEVFDPKTRHTGKIETLPSLLLTLVKKYDTDVCLYD